MGTERKNLLNMLCDLSDLSALVAGSDDIDTFLQRTVELVADHLKTPVCSVYLYEEAGNELVLRATRGLNPESVGRVRMPPGEGLVGNVLASRRPLREGQASRNPAFKYFPETGELPYESFLAVPILKGVVDIGVLVVQHTQSDYFEPTDATALRATGAQLAAALENARLLIDMQSGAGQTQLPPVCPSLVKGKMVSEGYACAPALVWSRSHGVRLSGGDAAETGNLDDFTRAVRRTTDQLDHLQRVCARRLPESAALIFTAHFMILKDRHFTGRMEERIREGLPATRAVREIAGHYRERFASSPHPYIREKVSDIEDLAGRLLANLRQAEIEEGDLAASRIVVAEELYPSEVLKLSAQDIAGIVLTGGGITSHVAIIARALRIPLVMAPRQELLSLPEKTRLLLDGQTGNIHLNPSAEVVREFEESRQARTFLADSKPPKDCGNACTTDGTRVTLQANINLLSELPMIQETGAAGIGLYRTEFPFLVRPTFPSETEQYLVYRQVIEAMAGKPVAFRTLDIGGEKTLSYMDRKAEANPELGLRSIRFTLEHREVFEQQLRALLRAAAGHSATGILFPLISSPDEFLVARQVVRDCLAQLKKEGLSHFPDPVIGMMVELPSVVGMMEEFAAVADFFAVGTNDFVQYMLGADRANRRVAAWYRPEHPAVLRALSTVVSVAGEKGKPVSVCGEMAHDDAMIPFLLGIGIHRLSVAPQYLPHVYDRISGLSIARCRDHAQKMLAAGSLAAVKHVGTI
jgi:phosphotransferase system enzyme I (PtsP)